MATPNKPSRKKALPAKTKPVTAKTRKRARATTKALAVPDAKKHEAVGISSFGDTQMALLQAMMAMSPVRMLLRQQAAFWRGLAGSHGSTRR
jgi:hypothetical protein